MNTVELIKISVTNTPCGTNTAVEGKSPGVAHCDLLEIVRCVSNIELDPSGHVNILNLFFQHVPSGASVIGRLVPVLNESHTETLSGRASVQCLIVTEQILEDFGNNPVVLYQTILNSGGLAAFLTNDETLSPLTLRERNATFDWELVRGLAANPGCNSLAMLLDSVLYEIETFFSGHLSGVHLLAGLFNLLPPHWRPELTFATGLSFREDCDFRIVGIPVENSEMIARCQRGKRTYFDLDANREYQIIGCWGIFIWEILKNDRLSFLVPRLLKHQIKRMNNEERSTLTTEEVERLGWKWLEEYERQAENRKNRTHPNRDRDKSPDDMEAEKEQPIQIGSEVPYPGHLPSMLSHEEPLVHYEPGNRLFSPYQRLYAAWPQHRDTFLQLDSLIGHILKYESGAVEALREYWGQIERQLNESVLWAIREEYIHFVQTSLMEDADNEAFPAQKSLYTLEILDILVSQDA